MVNAIIKCPKCGQTYNVNHGDLHQGPLSYHCNRCNNDFQVEFFDHCPQCNVNIGFVETGSFKDDMTSIGTDIAKGIFNPLSTVTSFGGYFVESFSGKRKDCNGDGVCPICNKRYLRCPQCNELFMIKRRAIWKDTSMCPHCGCEVNPCCSIRPGCGKKHSKEFK